MFLTAPFKQLLRYRKVLVRTSLVELRALYAGSALGLVWVFLGPLLLLLLYAVMFQVVLRVKPATMSGAEYLSYMCAGLVSMLAFSSALTAAAGSLTKNRQILLNTVFPAELVPVRAAIVASVVLPAGLILVIAAAAITSRVGWPLLLVPFVVVLQLMLSCGLGWLLSLLTLALRDTTMFLQYVTMALLFVTPIGFTPEMAPPLFKLLMYMNPLTYYVVCLQELIVFNRFPDARILGACIVLSLVVFCGGFWVFQRAKQTFLDYA